MLDKKSNTNLGKYLTKYYKQKWLFIKKNTQLISTTFLHDRWTIHSGNPRKLECGMQRFVKYCWKDFIQG